MAKDLETAINATLDAGVEGAEAAGVTKSEKALVQRWKKEIAEAEEREKKWRKEAEEVVRIYEAGKEDAKSFNILYANTETIRPHLFAQSPTVSVKPRFSKSPVAKAAALVLQRGLEYVLDPNNPETGSFELSARSAVTDALISDRGVLWTSYIAKFAEIEDGSAEVELEDGQLDPENNAAEDEVSEGEAPATAPKERVVYEALSIRQLPHDRLLVGYASCWADVPWIARIDYMTREELTTAFGKGKAGQVKLDVQDCGEAEGEAAPPKDSKGVKMTKVYQIWDKASKKVLSIATGADFLLKMVDDPLELEGMFPIAEPLGFTQKLSSMVPIPLYRFYKPQAEELNDICRRISALVRALKIRGFYDSSLQGLEGLMASGDNTLLAAENVAALQTSGGIERAVWFFPIERIAPVLQQLYTQRESVKQIIYEIMGIGDIIRGGGRASESATQTNLKSQYGSFRLQDMQGAAEYYVTNTLRIMAEMIATRFSTTTLQQITSLPFPTEEEKQLAQQQLQLSQGAVGPDGQPVPPDPALVAAAQSPSWEEIQAFMRDDPSRNFQLDIESGSSAAADQQKNMEDFSALLNGFAQFGNAIGPLIEAGFLDGNAAKALFMSFVGKTNLGNEVEEAIRAMPVATPKQEQPDPKAAAEAQLAAVKVQAAQDKASSDKQIQALQAEAEATKNEFQKQKMLMESERDQMRRELEMLRLSDARRKSAEAAQPQGTDNAVV